MLKCSKCGLEKSTTEFFSNKKRKSGFDCYCKECRKIYSRKHYGMQTKYYLNKTYRNKQRLKDVILDYKQGKKCCRCGFDNPIALDFHHRNPKDKEFSISKASIKGIGKEKLDKEIAKCDILCANCHRIEHSKNSA